MRKIPLLSQSFRKGDAPQINEEGKFRVKEHVQGDWPSHVYIDVPLQESLLQIQKVILEFAQSRGLKCMAMDDCHISLSKTFYPKTHHLNGLEESFSKSLKVFSAFTVSFDQQLNPYSNELQTRFFLSLECDAPTGNHLKPIIDGVDSILRDYNFAAFYENPSFHVSLAWSPSNIFTSDFVSSLNEVIFTKLKSHIDFPVDFIIIRMGNRERRIELVKDCL